jgi:AcrR family transcriptional regulator
MEKSTSRIGHNPPSATDNGVLGLSSKDKLLRSAEVLFSTKGFREISVREIAAHAGVNSALIGYYFHGKQALFDEVLRIHAIPLSQERMKRLKAITQNGCKPSVEEVLRAWLLPWLQLGNNQRTSAVHLHITANLSYEKWECSKMGSRYMKYAQSAFVNAMHSCLPDLSIETLICRLYFVMGALIFGMQQSAPLIALSGGRCDPRNLEATFNQILPYAVAGFCALEPDQ